MSRIILGLGVTNPTVGAVQRNTDQLITQAREMEGCGCDIGLFGECAIIGYSPEDLVQWPTLIDAQIAHLVRFVHETKDHACLYVIGLIFGRQGNLYNVAALVGQGRILGLVPKEHLPTYEIFYEQRTLTPGMPGMFHTVSIDSNGTSFHSIPFGDVVFDLPFGRIALEVCEDLWCNDGPLVRRAYAGAELVLNTSASPFRSGVHEVRRELLRRRSADNNCAIAYTSIVGGQDGLVFDGASLVSLCGHLVHDGERFVRAGSVHTCIVYTSEVSRARIKDTTWRVAARNVGTRSCPHVLEYKDLRVFADESFSPNARLANRAMPFAPVPEQHRNPLDVYFEELLEALTLGQSDYMEKSGAFPHGFLVSLSGGRDSYLALVISYLSTIRAGGVCQNVKAFDRVLAVSMPTEFNSDTTKSIAEQGAKEMGVSFAEMSIQQFYEMELRALELLGNPQGVVRENVQARIRGMRMWNVANLTKRMWVQTGNMSERAVGYTTIGGDNMGVQCVIGNVAKTTVIALLDWLATDSGWAYVTTRVPSAPKQPWHSLVELNGTRSSAELGVDQFDEDELMPFPILDRCLDLFVSEKCSPVQMYETLCSEYPALLSSDIAHWVTRFITLFFRSVFKWVQAPIGIHVGSTDLDRERALQVPVITSLEWLQADLQILRDTHGVRV